MVNILAKNVLVYLILAKKNIFECLTSKGQVTQTAQPTEVINIFSQFLLNFKSTHTRKSHL